MYHVPVLLNEVVDALNINPNGIYVDATYGGGGHSKKIFSKLINGRLIGFDQDEAALVNAIDDERFVIVNQNFRYLRNFLRYHKALPIDGILADLGVSSHQFDTAERGFSTRFDGPLDLRMDNTIEKDAKYIINNYKEDQLILIFQNYGEIHNTKTLVKLIIEDRKIKKINNTKEFIEVLHKVAPRGKEYSYYAQAFQALRIEVNDELDALKTFLKQLPDVLNQGGRVAMLSYHSLEDRLVKNFFKTGNFEGIVNKDFYGNIEVPFSIINRKPIIPSDEEIKENPRARSAKLRVAEKK